MATGEALRSEPSFSDWTRPDLQCYEVGSSSESLPKEECLQDDPCLASPQICKRLFRGAAAEGQKESWAVNPAQLRRAVKRSFELLQADEKLKGHEILDPPPKKRLWAVRHLVGQLAWRRPMHCSRHQSNSGSPEWQKLRVPAVSEKHTQALRDMYLLQHPEAADAKQLVSRSTTLV